jgi:sigma-B regulation protein RsbU (phosphoserine phosphatase)
MLALSQTALPLFAQIVPPAVRAELRWEFLNVAAAIALFSVALVAIALFFFRRKTRDLTLIYFGLFCSMYAIRLLGDMRLFRALFDEPRTFWEHLNWIITCTILVPFGFFFYHVSSAYLRRFFRWILAAQTVFAVFGVFAAARGFSLAMLHIANNFVVLTTCIVTVLFLIWDRWRQGPDQVANHEMRVFTVGLMVWFLFIAQANLRGLRLIAGNNWEFLGFLMFVGCLGYISGYRIFANEERLLAISKELDIARRIQSSILPQGVPALAGLEVATRYVPMSAVAGDFYDYLFVDEKRLGILVADVTGHGVPAALIASMLKVAFAGQASHAHDPARVLTGLNLALCGKFEEHFVTAAYLFVDLENSLLRYSAAGHPPLILATRTEGTVREVEQNGLMLGLFPEATYASMEIRIANGDRCLLYTDGVFEASNSAREEFGKARCKEFLASHRHLPAARFADDLLTSITAFSGLNSTRAQEDDITLLVLDFQPAASNVQ